MRLPSLILVSLFACGPDLPAGESLFAVSGGWCDGPCTRWTVFRDGTQLALAVWEGGELDKVNRGALTPAGEAAITSAAQEFGPELVDDDLSCSAVDGADYEVTLERDGMAYTLRYCVGLEQFEALTELMTSFVVALGTCTENAWTTIGKCKP